MPIKKFSGKVSGEGGHVKVGLPAEGGGGGGGGAPVVAGLVNWVKADAGITKDGGDVVSVWADQSGNGTN
jgi:hypothetical protein